MATAMTVGAGVTATRAYIAAKHSAWLTPRRLRAITATLISAGFLASATLVGGSAATPNQGHAAQQVHQR